MLNLPHSGPKSLILVLEMHDLGLFCLVLGHISLFLGLFGLFFVDERDFSVFLFQDFHFYFSKKKSFLESFLESFEEDRPILIFFLKKKIDLHERFCVTYWTKLPL